MGIVSEFKALFTAILDQSVQRSTRELIAQLVADIGEKSEYSGALPIHANLPKGDPEDGMKKMFQGINTL